jgi:hypothetical protein
MSTDRILDLQERLDRLYGVLKGQELGKDEAETAEKARIQLKINGNLKEIRGVEQDYVSAIAQQVKRKDMPEVLAQELVSELLDGVELIQPTVKNDDVQAMLQKILDELQKPGVPAAAKLKIAIPLVPGIVAIELESDAESVVRRLFSTFVKVYKGIQSLTGKDQPGK